MRREGVNGWVNGGLILSTIVMIKGIEIKGNWFQRIEKQCGHSIDVFNVKTTTSRLVCSLGMMNPHCR